MSSPIVSTLGDNIDDVMQILMDHNTIPTFSASQRQSSSPRPYVEILEQPASRNLRFRYECEGRSAGSIVGVNSTPENRTHPTIKVHNYKGPFIIVASAVTKDGPFYKPHPHNLVGKEGCKKGIFYVVVENNSEMTYSFTSLGIQCVKRRDIEKSLNVRQTCRVDPFGTGFGHMTQPGSIDLNILRLCFQVFITGPDGKCTDALDPVVSETICDKKAMSDLTIVKLSHYAASVRGNTEVILLCDRVTKEDIQVWFFEEKNSVIIWEGQAEFQASDVHKQVAISFRTPRYHDENIQDPVSIFIQLRRPSDKLVGQPRPFQFLPIPRDPEGIIRKRSKMENSCYKPYFEAGTFSESQAIQERMAPIAVPRLIRHPVRHSVKQEPVAGPSDLDSFPGVSMLQMQTQYSSNSSAVTVPPSIDLGQTIHLTPVASPLMAMSPGACSYASSVSPPAGMPSMMPGTPYAPVSPAQSTIDEVLVGSNPLQTATSNLDETIINDFSSFGFQIDSKELMTLNLSTGIFDSIESANNLMVSALQGATQSQTMTTEDNLNQNTMMQNQMSKYC